MKEEKINIRQKIMPMTNILLELAHANVQMQHGRLDDLDKYTELLEIEIERLMDELRIHALVLWNSSMMHLPSCYLPPKSAK